MNIFKRKNFLQINFDDGRVYTNTNCSEELWNLISINVDREDELERFIFKTEDLSGNQLKGKLKDSKILTLRGNSVYMLDVSEISIPEDFVSKILQAELEGNEAELKKYKNFWTLVSLNPDSRVRDNIFWFIRKWDMKIADSGLIVAYRNADIKHESNYSIQFTKDIINRYYVEKYINENDPYDIYGVDGGINETSLGELYDDIVNNGNSTIYTDHHSHTMTIRLGQPVKMDRSKVDSDQTHFCSSGLHCGAKKWLKQNYFGEVGMMVLVNPASVCSIPPGEDYGKMRTCEYFPVALIDFDENGDVIEPEYNIYNDVKYLEYIKYDGTINNEDLDQYEIKNTFATREELYDSILKRINGD